MEKRITVLFCVVAVFTSSLFAFVGGSGTADEPYQISTLAHLQQVNSDLSAHYILLNDINLADETFTNSIIAPMIYSNSPQFLGAFDGNGFAIKNLTINGGGREAIGFFGRIGRVSGISSDTGLVKNLGIENADIVGGTSVAALAGYSTGQIVDCYATGVVTATSSNAGGLVGRTSEASISNSYADVDVYGASRAGGLVGYLWATFVVSCFAQGDVSGTGSVGGFIGEQYQYGYGFVRNCYATGDVTATGGYAGGFIGKEVGASGNMQNCFALGNVNAGGDYVGGFIGNVTGRVRNCYASGSVSGVSRVGGFSGFGSGTISQSYSTGLVQASGSDVGGFNGSGTPTVTACFWDMQTSNQPTSARGTGKTTAEMQDIQTFLNASWDFADEQTNGRHNIWYMAANGYPDITYINQSLQPILDGDGTPQNPYKIAAPADILAINWASSAHYILADDIDLDGMTFNNSPVAALSGSLDGGGYALKNLTITAPNQYYVGLFAMVCGGAKITNLTVDTAVISAISQLGTITAHNRGFINHTHVLNTSVYGSWAGGFVGSNYFALITNCSVSGLVSSQEFNIGGFAADLRGGTVERSWSSATVSGGGSLSPNIGGFAGGSSASALVRDSYATGNVTAGTYMCERVGGFIGWFTASTAVNCYSTGRVSGGTKEVGGFAGNGSWSTATNCFWDTETSNRTTSARGTGKTTEEMQDIQTFLAAGWDFVNETDNGLMDLWHIQPLDYPKLYWQAAKGDMNYDGTIDLDDLLIMATQWLASPQAEQRLAADINEDGTVDLADYAIISNAWDLNPPSHQPEDPHPQATHSSVPRL